MPNDALDRQDVHGRLIRVETLLLTQHDTLDQQGETIREIDHKVDALVAYVDGRRGATRNVERTGLFLLTILSALIGGLASTVAQWLHLKS